MDYSLGWVKDKKDSRDHLYFAKYFGNIVMAERKKVLPEYVDLRDKLSKIENQETLGSCTANAVVAMFEYLDNKDDQEYADYSRLFLYYNTRILHGTIFEDSGASLRNTIKASAALGVCKETGWLGWEYNIKKFAKKPWFWCYWGAKDVKAKEYLRLSQRLEVFKYCLAQGFPFAFGFTVFDSFMNGDVKNDGIMEMPEKNEKSNGGHAVCVVGYDDSAQVFIVRNSWGEEWGHDGYFYMPYEFILNKEYCNDFWTIMRY